MNTISKLLLTLFMVIIIVVAYFSLQQQIRTLQNNNYASLSQQMNSQVQRLIDAKSKSVLGIALALSKDSTIHDILKNSRVLASETQEQINLSRLLKRIQSLKMFGFKLLINRVLVLAEAAVGQKSMVIHCGWRG